MSNTAVLEQLQLKPHTGVVPGMVCSVFLKILRKLDKWRIQDYMIRNGVSGKFNLCTKLRLFVLCMSRGAFSLLFMDF